MLSRHFDSIFDNDPFFEGHRRHMREMDKFMRDPFQAFREPLGIEEGTSDGRRRRGDRHEPRDGGRRDDQLALRGLSEGFGGMFRSMQEMMENMHKNFEKAASSPDGHMLSHSSFASYSNMGGGSEPKVFQASTSTHRAPGGVRETRKTLRDSESGQEKMAIGRYIGDKGHLIQRERNRRSGKEDENQEYVNMGEEEYGEFDRQWKDRTGRLREKPIDGGRRGGDRDLRRQARAVKF